MMYLKDMKRHCAKLDDDDIEIYVKLPNGEIAELWSHYYPTNDGNCIVFECATPIKGVE